MVSFLFSTTSLRLSSALTKLFVIFILILKEKIFRAFWLTFRNKFLIKKLNNSSRWYENRLSILLNNSRQKDDMITSMINYYTYFSFDKCHLKKRTCWLSNSNVKWVDGFQRSLCKTNSSNACLYLTSTESNINDEERERETE